MLITGDYKWYYVNWGISKTDSKGHILKDIFLYLQVIIIIENKKQTHVPSCCGTFSALYLTIASKSLL